MRTTLAPIFGIVFLITNFTATYAQPVRVELRSVGNQATISWTNGLSLVQPQKATNVAGAWQDFGPATTATNVSDVLGDAAFYRLRLLPPSVTLQPLGQSNSTGSLITFMVTGTGTAPLLYQWRKNGTNLPGQTATLLSLFGTTTNDSGNYTVFITNRAGSVTSAVAVLSITNPTPPLSGVYMGSFAGQVDAGGFAVLLRSNGLAFLVGYNTPQNEGVFSSGFSVASNGLFNTITAAGGKVGGTFTTNNISGGFTNSTGGVGSYSGARKADTGIHSADVGYYTGLFTNLVDSIVGNAYAVLAADGTIFFYSIDSTGDGGGTGTINAGNTVSATTVPDGFTVGGTLNTSTHVISGTYKLGATTVGTYSITRTQTP